MNFGDQILNQQMLNDMSLQDITEILDKLERKYQPIELEEIQKMNINIESLHNDVSKRFSSTGSEKKATGSLVRMFFSICGDQNEKLWEDAIAQRRHMPKNSCDYPFICLSNQIRQRNRNSHEFYAHILGAIDYGRGAIVAREKRRNEKIYYLPLLTAGERNYKYKEERYFPILYGLFEIEQKAVQKAIDPYACKKTFLERYKSLEQFDDAELMELNAFCDTDITAQYMPVLLKDIWFYPDKNKINRSKNLAYEIMQ